MRKNRLKKERCIDAFKRRSYVVNLTQLQLYHYMSFISFKVGYLVSVIVMSIMVFQKRLDLGTIQSLHWYPYPYCPLRVW